MKPEHLIRSCRKLRFRRLAHRAAFWLVVLQTAASPAQHQYHYDSPEIQKQIDKLKAGRGTTFLPLQAGATMTAQGRRFTITAVHNDGVALLLEGTIQNLTGSTMYAEPLPLMLNESPDQQMKWFKAHPVTSEYHYGPGWNSHSEVNAQVSLIERGGIGTFTAVWLITTGSIAAEPPENLVVLPDASR